MLKKIAGWILAAVVFVGQGYAPANPASPAQGQMLARRAAIVDCQRKAGGAPGLSIISESWDGSVYTVQMEAR